MDAAATIVWMAPEPPDSEQSRALVTWSHAHGVKLAPPQRAAVPRLAVDGGLADKVETLVDRARDAVGARDPDGADHALAAAESMLRAHPELPQASWLMAEVLRARASRLRRLPPGDADAAERMWLRAEALDGGRVFGVGEQGSAKHPEPARLTLDLSRSSEDVELWLDGEPWRWDSSGTSVPASPRNHNERETRAGLHALVATWGGAPVWAEWIETRPGSPSLQVSAVGAPPCSTDDVARAHRSADTDRVPSSLKAFDARDVRCDTWVAAGTGTRPGSIMVASCQADHCGPLFEWRAPGPWTWSPDAEHRKEKKWPAWATWGLAGVGAALVAGATVVVAGALQPVPTETRFVNGGVKSQ